jgi:HD-GYP domain-containing protein (c-di-GMP phosphodiesterase class II)
VTLADSYDAMTSNRAYRSALPTELAVEELKLCSGTQFDPQLVDLFIEKEIYLL